MATPGGGYLHSVAVRDTNGLPGPSGPVRAGDAEGPSGPVRAGDAEGPSGPVRAGDIDGRYARRQRLGRGGFGIVWRAHDTLLQRDVAIKEVEFPGVLEADDAPPCAESAAGGPGRGPPEPSGRRHRLRRGRGGRPPVHRDGAGRRPDLAEIVD